MISMKALIEKVKLGKQGFALSVQQLVGFLIVVLLAAYFASPIFTAVSNATASSGNSLFNSVFPIVVVVGLILIVLAAVGLYKYSGGKK